MSDSHDPAFDAHGTDRNEMGKQIDFLNDVLDQAKLDLVAAYGLNSLFWIYLNIKGESPQGHAVKQELERIRDCMSKVKAILDKKKAPRLDPNVAKRFIRNALWEPKDTESTAEEVRVSGGDAQETNTVPHFAEKRKPKDNQDGSFKRSKTYGQQQQKKNKPPGKRFRKEER